MPNLLKLSRLTFAAVALFGLALFIMPACARQPNVANPTASAVTEQHLLNEMNIISGRGTIPDVRSQNLIQPAGRDWQKGRPLWPYVCKRCTLFWSIFR